MPLSLLIKKDAIKLGLDCEMLKTYHCLDIQILVVAINIEQASAELERLKQMKMAKKGIKEIRQSTEQDFDSL